MKLLKNIRSRIAIMTELLSFFWKNKMWWMIPFVVTLLLIGILITVAGSSPLAPFVYTIF